MTAQRFDVGDRVRVRAGVTDPDFPALSIAGWVGVVTQVDATTPPALFLVVWTPETLAAAPRKFRRRCDVAGLEVDSIWLADDDLEPDATGALLVPPTPALDLSDPEDLARSVLGLSADADLPEVSLENLARFHAYLQQQLTFPYPAGLDLEDGPLGSGLRPVMVLRVLPAERSLPVVGLMAEVSLEKERIEVPLAVLHPSDEAGHRELSAYVAWIGSRLPATPSRSRPTHPFVKFGILLALLGGVTGAVVEALPGGELAALLGALALATVGFFAGAYVERWFRASNRLPPGLFGGAALGLLAGAGFGASVGAASLAFLGSIPGAILASLGNWLLARAVRRRFPSLLTTIFGMGVGALAYATWMDWGAALRGLGVGLLLGVVGAAALVGTAMAYLTVVFRFEDGE